jgi:glycosyltransferase involved in cell wall biosynthesis
MSGLQVLFVGHTYITTLAQKKLDVLAKNGVVVGLLAPQTWTPTDGLFAKQTIVLPKTFDSFHIYSSKVIRSGHIASYLFPLQAIVHAVRDFEPDIIHIEQEFYSLTTLEVMLIAKLLRKKVSVFGWENLDRSINISQRIARRINLALADAVICGNTDGVKLARKWGFQKQVEVMPELGIDQAMFFPRPRLADGLIRIGFVGRMVTEKGGDILLRAFKILTEKDTTARLVFAGSGPQRAEWQELAKELCITKWVDWVDSVPNEEVPEIMALLDILVLPSRTMLWWKEQFGLVLTQAMAMGIPVVGSDSGAIPEVIGRSELIFPENNATELAAILHMLIDDLPWRHEVAQFGLSRISELFTHETIANKLIKIWGQIVVGKEQ